MKNFFSAVVSDAAPIGGSPSLAARQAGPSLGGSTLLETRLRRARLGLLVGLVGIVMIFVSFTSAYVVRQGLPTVDPRTDTLIRDWFALPLPRLLFVNTLVLLVSSATMELARRQIARQAAMTRTALSNLGTESDRRWNASWLALTVVLGLSFLAGQWTAWRELAARGFYVSTNPSSSFFYLLTGTHGVHLLGGVLALVVAMVAALLRRPIESRVVILDIAGWYWHFMAALWIYILCLLKFAR